MAAKSREKLYRFQVANLRALDHAIDHARASLRDSIRRDDKPKVSSYERLCAFLLAAWAEVRLEKLLLEEPAFVQSDLEVIPKSDPILDRWTRVVEMSFRKHYQIPKAELSEKSLSHSAYSRLTTLISLLENEIRPVVQLRNKLAHGQWIYPLNAEGTDVAQAEMNALAQENILSLGFKKTILLETAALVHDLVVSRDTFNRDFDKHFANIVGAKENLKNRDYGQYAANLRDKMVRGQRKKKTNRAT